MATKEDISVFNGPDALTFRCKACGNQFASMPSKEAVRRTADRTLEQEVERITKEHLRTCQ
jgi:tRNA(Ile2) C34 agmatinyltransferase TiaS